ncbi:MAG: family 16 glycoside hydrolase [Phycisphaerales bacterium JB063]
MTHLLTSTVAAALLTSIITGCCARPPQDPGQADATPAAEPAPVALLESQADWDKLNFGADGEVFFEDNALHLDMGGPLTGVVYNGDIAELLGDTLEDYEITLEAQRLQGSDFFVGLTFPVGTDGHVTLIMGGWGGGLVGLSNLDHADASMNSTTQLMQFESNRWYTVRVAVTGEAIQVWLDGEQLINLDRANHTDYSLRGEVMITEPLGLCCYQTHAAYRNMVVKRLPPGE